MNARQLRLPFVLALLALAPACTHDFSVFDVAASGVANGGGGNGAAGGASGGAAGTSMSGTGATGANGGSSTSGATGAGGATDAATPLDASGANGGAGAGGSAGAGTCNSNQKACGSQCVSVDSTATGCGGPACDPCAPQNATSATCNAGECAATACQPGFDDCDLDKPNGCERAILGDPFNCGACDRACGTVHVASVECPASGGGNRCTSFCQPGFANCAQPTSGTDIGCETATASDPANCGGCGNMCPNGFACTNSQCGCSNDGDCRGQGDTTSTCNAGVCVCGGTDTCSPGETCRQSPGGASCRCNGGKACSNTETCCRTGCADLTSSASDCGSCGHSCPTNFVCTAGACACNDNSDCSAGGTGTCSSGVCTCGTTACSAGQRCLSNGQCG